MEMDWDGTEFWLEGDALTPAFWRDFADRHRDLTFRQAERLVDEMDEDELDDLYLQYIQRLGEDPEIRRTVDQGMDKARHQLVESVKTAEQMGYPFTDALDLEGRFLNELERSGVDPDHAFLVCDRLDFKAALADPDGYLKAK